MFKRSLVLSVLVIIFFSAITSSVLAKSSPCSCFFGVEIYDKNMDQIGYVRYGSLMPLSKDKFPIKIKSLMTDYSDKWICQVKIKDDYFEGKNLAEDYLFTSGKKGKPPYF